MKTGSKVLLGISGAVLLTAGSIAGTLAFLTAEDTVTNTFTIGKVDIDLTETDVDENGKPIENAERVKENEYRLVPGMTYTKDPTITVKADSEEAYIRMMVTIENWKAMEEFAGTPEALFTDLNTDSWKAGTSVEDGNNLILEYRYVTADAEDNDTVTGAAADYDLEALFKTLEIPNTIESEDMTALNGFKIVVQGHAIQSTGFGSADEAWAAFENQETPAETTAASE